jgi:hypothetical protein
MDGRTHPAATGRITKTPTHTLTRVRNNQRRHRQRRREYIASLEQRLKDTEDRLAQVQAENVVLRDKVLSTSPLGQERRETASLTIPETNVTTQIVSTAAGVSRGIRYNPADVTGTDTGSDSVASVAVLQPTLPSQEVGCESYEVSLVGDILPCPLFPNLPVSIDTEFTPPTTYLVPPPAVQPGSACCSRTSPEPSTNILNKDTSWLNSQTSVYGASMLLSTSSTTLCSQAYFIIQHHNHRQLPMEAVERWLWPGFIYSGPLAEKGCRVDNQLLLGLLEYITEWENFDR